ncbi:MAG: hypothetical protein AAF587_32495 [Bacteroidota bacterium]
MTSTTPNSITSILKEISLKNPSDKIIQQIRERIPSGQLNPGEEMEILRRRVNA